MSKHYFIVFILMSIVFCGCSNQDSELSEQRKSQIENQILNEWTKICTTVEQSDSDGYAAFFSPDFILMSTDGSVFYSKKEYIDNVRNWFNARESTEIQQDKIVVTVLEEDLVLLDQESVFKVSYKDGTSQQVKHAATMVFKEEPSGWKIIHGHESIKEIE
jgi:uncharacterized protein (TIGR02246 family)